MQPDPNDDSPQTDNDVLLELDVSACATEPLIQRHIALRAYDFTRPAAAPELVEAAARSWEERARSEYLGVLIFRHLHDLMIDLNAPMDLQQLSLELMSHENRHAVACAQAAQSLGGGAGYVFGLDELRLHRTQQPLGTQLVDQVVTVLCCGEVVAYALLKHTVKALPPSPYRDVLTDILRDEVLHGTVGFTLLAQLKAGGWCPWPGDDHVRRVVSTYMQGLRSRDVVDPEEEALFEVPDNLAPLLAMGVPPTSAFKECYFEAIPSSFASGFASIDLPLNLS